MAYHYLQEICCIFKCLRKCFFTGSVLLSQANDKGDYFPIWGTCLGLQLLTVLVAGENLLSRTIAENVTYPLNFTTGTTIDLQYKS